MIICRRSPVAGYAAPVDPDERLVAGVDAGATRVRALVVDLAGGRRGTGVAGGANPVSRGLDAAMAEVARALEGALSTVDIAKVALVALGIAGGTTHGGDGLGEALDAVWVRLGLRCPRMLVSDVEVAFAAGTASPDGLVVLAGTGAAVAEIRAGAMTRYLDAKGWLVGDVGSGFWLGLRALRAAVADLEGRGTPTALTPLVAADLGIALPHHPDGAAPGSDRTVRDLLAAAYRRPPITLSELAPLVSRTAADGDPVARALVDRAAETLLDEAGVLLRDGPGARSAVVAGSVLVTPGPVRDAVRRGLAERFDLEVGDGRDGAAGAAWLAARRLGPPIAAGDVHRRLTAAD